METIQQPDSSGPLGRGRRLQWGTALSGESVEFRIWAPEREEVQVEIVDDELRVIRLLPMLKGSDGFHTGHDKEGLPGDRYRFRLDGQNAYPDPASRAQSGGVHGASVVVDASTFPWTDSAWVRPRFRDLVIYELHIGTFTPEGTFLAAIEKLPHLKDLHVNAIEIMPVGDFPGERGWGYDGVLLYAPASCYGSPDDLRRLVNAAHATGIAVILDVVYNHFGPDGNYVEEYAPNFVRRDRETPWGAAFNIDGRQSAPIRAFFAENPIYWMDEFHIDGFRLDAIHEIHDESPKHLLVEISEAVTGRGGYVIAEDPRNEAQLASPVHQGGFGFHAVWADDFHHSAVVSQTRQQDSYYKDFSGTLPEFVEILQHGWLYRGRWSEAMKLERGTECQHLPPQAFVHCISNHDQTGNRAFGDRLSARVDPAAYRALSMLICLSPYTPMLFMGQEWGVSTPFTFFSDHHGALGPLVSEGRAREFADFPEFKCPDALAKIPDPQAEATFEMSKLAWQETSSMPHAGVLGLYEACLRLRRHCSVFRPSDRSGWQVAQLGMGTAAIRFGEDSASFLLIINLWGSPGGSLEAEPVAALPEGWRWALRLSTNAPEFGGTSSATFDLSSQTIAFSGPEALLFEAGPVTKR